ncbi:VOC family protein [Actinoplanes sp. NPDC051346]|uniref:VOC family protein n=1 Tax=Actinoplanes sp. NPDC051346 TaxID=3155048 RepID=UPI003431695C
MTTPIRHITIDAHDPWRLAQFWAQVTGYTVSDEDAPGDDEALLTSEESGSPGLLFIRVPEEKIVKNRVHLDIEPPVGTRDETVERLLAAGATLHEDHRKDDGLGWVTLRDPEGNEFCVERGAAERGQTQA